MKLVDEDDVATLSVFVRRIHEHTGNNVDLDAFPTRDSILKSR